MRRDEKERGHRTRVREGRGGERKFDGREERGEERGRERGINDEDDAGGLRERREKEEREERERREKEE